MGTEDQAPLRHPERPPYRCFLPDLAGFEGFRRAGPNPQPPSSIVLLAYMYIKITQCFRTTRMVSESDALSSERIRGKPKGPRRSCTPHQAHVTGIPP